MKSRITRLFNMELWKVSNSERPYVMYSVYVQGRMPSSEVDGWQ